MNIDYSRLSDAIDIELAYSANELQSVRVSSCVRAIVDSQDVVTLIVERPQENAQLFANLICELGSKASRTFEEIRSFVNAGEV